MKIVWTILIFQKYSNYFVRFFFYKSLNLELLFKSLFLQTIFCSLKLLWAPIVDSVYWRRVGRRKSWMVPCQYLIGVFMFVLSYSVDYILGEDDRGFLILFKFRFSCKIYWRFAGLKNDSDTEKTWFGWSASKFRKKW